MKDFKTEQERFESYYNEICKTILDITMGIVDDQANVTIINILDLLIKLESIEDRATKVKLLKIFKKGFVEKLGEKVKEIIKNNENEEEQEENNKNIN